MKDKKELPLALKVVRLIFPIAERVFPTMARNWAIHKFSQPLKYKVKEVEKVFLTKAEWKNISYKKNKIQVYEWGIKNEGPWVLLVHGWAGRSGQFRDLIPSLVSGGFKVLAFDGKAHGHSEGKKTNLMETRDVIEILANKYGMFHAIVGHSFGGVASAFALNGLVKSNHLFLVNSPSVSRDIISTFVKTINGSDLLVKHFYNYIRTQFGRDFDDLELIKILPEIIADGVSVSIIADESDDQVPIRQSEIMIKQNKGLNSLITQNYGHNKILGSKELIDFVLDGIKTPRMVTIV